MADYNSAYTGQEIDAGIAKANAAVPGSRTVNGKALSADVTLSAADVGADAAGAASGVQTNLTSHTNNKSNPHSVTKAQVGLGNVDNTSDANKPISTATQTALNGKQATVTGGASTITSSNLTASRALVSNGSGKVAVSAVTSTEPVSYTHLDVYKRQGQRGCLRFPCKIGAVRTNGGNLLQEGGGNQLGCTTVCGGFGAKI